MEFNQLWQHHLGQAQARESLRAEARSWTAYDAKKLDGAFASLASEDDRRTVLMLCAAAEAGIQTECYRIANQQTSKLAKELKHKIDTRKDHGRGGGKDFPRLEGLLATLGKYANDPITAKAIQEFQNLLESRHWLAHGRHWPEPLLASSEDAWMTIRRLFDALGFYMPDKPTTWI